MSTPVTDLNQNPVDSKTTTGFNRFDQRNRKNLRTIGHRAITITAITCLFILIFYIFYHHHTDDHQHPKLCLTQGCVEAASILIKSIDTSVDPCDDFYQFVCGNWINETILPHGKNRIGTLNRIQERVNNKLRVDINRLSDNVHKVRRNTYESKLLSFYKSCINVDNIDVLNVDRLSKVIDFFGGWLTSLNRLDVNRFDLADKVLQLKELGANFNFLIAIDVGPDLRNTSNTIIAIDQPELVLKHKSLYTDASYLNSYARLIMHTATKLGFPLTPELISDIDEITRFEELLAKFMTSADQRKDYSKVYNRASLKNLRTFAPHIKWSKLLSGLVNQTLDLEEKIVVFDLPFVLNLDRFLYSLKPPYTMLHNYIVWRVIYELMPYAAKDWRDTYNTFQEGQKSDKPRWEECLDYMMDQGMDVALSSLYVKNHCDPETKKMASIAFQYIKNEFVGILEGIDWMGNETKTMALKKVKSMDAYIAYPEQILNHSLVDKFYENLTVDPNDFIVSILNLKRWNKERDLSQYGQKTTDIWWKQSQPAIVNAFYNPLENKIQLPAALLQGVFFETDRPYYLNFASFGFLIGHEITHGFDERGKQFDENGNLKDWWDSETDSKFRKKVQCMIDQYDGYYVDELNMTLSGDLSKGENMADNGGLKLALKAYESWSRGKPQEPPLPGLSFTPDKLFWIGAANFWCEKQSLTALQNQLLRDEHSPGRFRVIGPMSNIPEFAASFNCPVGSRMNPVKKCSVW